jgi:hypothetical protein
LFCSKDETAMTKSEVLVVGLLILFVAVAGLWHPFTFGLGDLYPRWLGVHELVLHGLDPYGSEVTREIQTAYYGHPLDPADRRDQQRFAYPLYVALWLWPTVWTPFHVVQWEVFVFLALVTAASVLCWLHVFHYTLPRRALIVIVMAVLASPPALQGLRLQQLGLLVAALIAGAAACAVSGRAGTAGALLALATIKPQMVLLPLIWFAVWAFTDWSKRRNLIVGFAATFAGLIALGELLSPGWVPRFLNGLVLYRHYAGATTADLFFGRKLGRLLTGLILLLLGLKLRRIMNGLSDSTFISRLALILAVQVSVLPALFNFLLFLPGILALMSPRSGVSEKEHSEKEHIDKLVHATDTVCRCDERR